MALVVHLFKTTKVLQITPEFQGFTFMSSKLKKLYIEFPARARVMAHMYPVCQEYCGDNLSEQEDKTKPPARKANRGFAHLLVPESG